MAVLFFPAALAALPRRSVMDNNSGIFRVTATQGESGVIAATLRDGARPCCEHPPSSLRDVTQVHR